MTSSYVPSIHVVSMLPSLMRVTDPWKDTFGLKVPFNLTNQQVPVVRHDDSFVVDAGEELQWPPMIDARKFAMVDALWAMRGSVKGMTRLSFSLFPSDLSAKQLFPARLSNLIHGILYSKVFVSSSRHVVPEAMRAETSPYEVGAWQGISPMGPSSMMTGAAYMSVPQSSVLRVG